MYYFNSPRDCSLLLYDKLFNFHKHILAGFFVQYPTYYALLKEHATVVFGWNNTGRQRQTSRARLDGKLMIWLGVLLLHGLGFYCYIWMRVKKYNQLSPRDLENSHPAFTVKWFSQFLVQYCQQGTHISLPAISKSCWNSRKKDKKKNASTKAL